MQVLHKQRRDPAADIERVVQRDGDEHDEAEIGAACGLAGVMRQLAVSKRQNAVCRHVVSSDFG